MSSLTVRGRSGHLIVPIVGIPAITIAAFTYFRDHLPEFCLENAEKVIASAALLTLALSVVAWFRAARQVSFEAGLVHYRSWVSDRTIAASRISNVTFETEVSPGPDQTVTEHYLSLWSGNDRLLRFNSALWPREGMARILGAIQQHNPATRFDHAVDRYITSTP